MHIHKGEHTTVRVACRLRAGHLRHRGTASPRKMRMLLPGGDHETGGYSGGGQVECDDTSTTHMKVCVLFLWLQVAFLPSFPSPNVPTTPPPSGHSPRTAQPSSCGLALNPRQQRMIIPAASPWIPTPSQIGQVEFNESPRRRCPVHLRRVRSTGDLFSATEDVNLSGRCRARSETSSPRVRRRPGI